MAQTKRSRWLILFNSVLVTFLCCLDSSSVNVALPMMAEDLGVDMALVEWVITANLLTIICFILVFGSIGDVIGKDRIFKFGITVFVLGALVCTVASSYPLLIAGRLVEGFGASATMATNQGLIAQTFPANERGRAMGISGSFVAMGSMLGPAFGGLIISHFSWNTIFLINVPVGLICLVMAFRILPKAEKGGRIQLDGAGSILFMAFIASLYFGVKSLQSSANHGASVVILLAAFLLGGVFIGAERRKAQPMLELSLFKNKLFTISVFCSFLSFFAIASNNFIQPFYLLKVQEVTPALAGMFMMTYPVVMFIVAPLSGALSDKIGSEILGFIGLAISSCGLFCMAGLGVATPMWFYMLGVALMALGASLFQSPNTSLIMSTVPKDKLGTAGSINGLVRNLGMVFGISLSTVILYTMMSAKLGYSTTDFVPGRADAFVYGMHFVYLFAAGICLVGVCLTGLRWWGSKHRQTAED